MSKQPTIFIGSSTENIEYANALQRVLDHDLVTIVWTYGVFRPGGSTLSALVERAVRSDFAALFLTPDDQSTVRGEYLKTPRDNLIFELGLFIGQLGSDRVFFLHPREGVALPSDLNGITPLTYRTDREDEDLQNAINPAATDIRSVAKQLGFRARDETRVERPAAPASRSVLVAISGLGKTAAAHGATVDIVPVGSQFKICVTDATRFTASVVVDLADSKASRAVDDLIQSLGPGSQTS